MSGPIHLTVNGTSRISGAAPTVPLLYVLRNELNLMGTRFGCGLEACGACVVLVDDQPAYACTLEVAAAAGRHVRTVEGLSVEGRAGPLQQAFLDEQAGQCGYCLSGILMSAQSLLERNAAPTREDIVAALDKHLCRCGSHQRIVRAVERAAEAMRA
ncbi:MULTISPECIES: (2Fe-2S)-binding protein [unclassified Mesorhizobium]|uniref:(2Fe-2S)-binding protein n=1 Tax=unclassified Mesorhizobium TaxID=325217 RepID=UPI001093C27E|nr:MULTISPECIES: (2Fe-2S)-binding protein [unclassified Mesorhizobium]TGQ77286.1 (2Fe-2S)-binding protein [Mesorhizobium sp. M8A.F.Ca.ET.207.01.1.1]TGS39040.1 (2Fe-2S)-binding protein [Mesorhizobium sp. M8A.F.Ca.ET.182.01.1.1]TGS77321.1 (2Fe-2S)-binding protein [Mesorhizobium sp. M8A.F.Ca.ET.181.01.1.1]TGT36297.1 (2Fe-2S)-binding protein [Mesorhizobium sp. M8A.F.Ca.ET.165.01.1.1]